jgi:NTE family protein
MTIPLVFKPIMIDSVLMFDGGVYNNFPHDVMERDFNPDVMVGAQCTVNPKIASEDDVMAQLVNLIMYEVDYSIPNEKGVLISSDYSMYATLDFHKIDEIVAKGYETTIALIKELEERISRRETAEALAQKRSSFRAGFAHLLFKDVVVQGSLTTMQKEFVDRTVRLQSRAPFHFSQLKRGYYRVLATQEVKTFYPRAQIRPDSLFDVYIRATRASPFRLSIGGNISSSSLNQGYLGFEYRIWGTTLAKTAIDLWAGKLYSGLNLYWRQDLGVRPLFFYEVNVTGHRFDYFSGSQDLFYSDANPNNMQESELFVTLNAGIPLSFRRSYVMKLGADMGTNSMTYFAVPEFKSTDKPEKVVVRYISPSLTVNRNTLDYKQYPTRGSNQLFNIRYIFGAETHKQGSLSLRDVEMEDVNRTFFTARFFDESYYRIGKSFSLGMLTDIALGGGPLMSDYIATIMAQPAFQPTPHSKTLLLDQYRANTYLGFGLIPVVRFTQSLSLRLSGFFFLPWQKVMQDQKGHLYYAEPFSKHSWMAEAALVWQSPIGPVSLSTNYYNKEANKFYPQLNIGYLIFKRKALSR